jgi:hypothetical protein
VVFDPMVEERSPDRAAFGERFLAASAIYTAYRERVRGVA